MPDAVAAIGVADDYEFFCFSRTYGVDELAFYSGYVGVENNFGFTTEILYCVEHQVLIVKD